MRQFTPKEKEMIDKIIRLKNKGELGELQFGKLIREDLNSVAITWEVGDNPSISVYSIYGQEQKRCYFEISDFLYLIDELANNHLIAIDYYNVDFDTVERILYDRKQYSTKPPKEYEDLFPHKDGELQFYRIIETDEHISISFSRMIRPQFNVKLANLFEKYANAIIYPLPLLIDIAENEFKDIEQRRFEEQLRQEQQQHNQTILDAIKQHKEQLNQERRHHKQTMLDATKKHKEQMCWTRWSFFIALLAVVIPSLISMYIFYNTPDTKVDNSQLKTIENAIKSTKSEFPNQIGVCLPDTITIKDIDQKPIINNIYNNTPQNNAQK